MSVEPNAAPADCFRCRLRDSLDDAPPPVEAFFSEYITVIVGPQRKDFRAHRDLLTHYSGYFKVALRRNVRTENQNKRIELSDDDPEIFAIFMKFMYEQRLFNALKAAPGTPGSDWIPISAMTLCETYVFGQRRNVPALKNTALNLLILKQLEDTFVSENTIKYVYENTAEGSGPRMLLSDIFAHCCDFKSEEVQGALKEQDVLPYEFLADVLSKGATSKVRAAEWYSQLDPCKYHDHTSI